MAPVLAFTLSQATADFDSALLDAMSYTLREYRINMPVTVDEYKIAQLYMTAKASEAESGKGEGVEILKNEACYDAVTGKRTGQYTHKKIHLSDRLPGWIKALMPSLKTLSLEEKATNSYPYCKTVYTSAFFDKLLMEITTIHAADRGEQHNIHNLTEADLKLRKVDVINIATEQPDKKHYKAEQDPALFLSKRTGRGLLKAEWWRDGEQQQQ